MWSTSNVKVSLYKDALNDWKSRVVGCDYPFCIKISEDASGFVAEEQDFMKAEDKSFSEKAHFMWCSGRVPIRIYLGVKCLLVGVKYDDLMESENLDSLIFEDFLPNEKTFENWSRDCLKISVPEFNSLVRKSLYTSGFDIIEKICERAQKEAHPIKSYHTLRSSCILVGQCIANDEAKKLSKACYELDSQEGTYEALTKSIRKYKPEITSLLLAILFKLFCKSIYRIRGYRASKYQTEQEMFDAVLHDIDDFESMWN